MKSGKEQRGWGWWKWAVAGGVAVVVAGCSREAPSGGLLPVKATFGSLGDTPGKFAGPRAVDCDEVRGGCLWVIDKAGRVQRIDPETGKCVAIWRMPEVELGKPVGLTLAPGPDEHGAWVDRLMWIPDTHYNRVMVYRPPPEGREGERVEETPTLVRQWGKYGTGPGEFTYPTDVLVEYTADGRGIERVYVSEFGGNDRVNVFDGELKWLFSFGSFGSSAAADNIQFNRPQSLAMETVGGVKTLFVTDSRNHRIGRFTRDGALIGWWGAPEGPGSGPGEFQYPYGLTRMGDGTALVTEFLGNRVQRIDLATGEGLGTWGHAGRGEGELASPWAIGILGETAYVTDYGNSRVVGMEMPRRR